MPLVIIRSLTVILLLLSLTLSLTAEAQSTYPDREVYLGKRDPMQSHFEERDSFSLSAAGGGAAAAIEPGRLYEMSATIYITGDSSSGNVIVGIVHGRVYRLSGRINSMAETAWTPVELAIQQPPGAAATTAKSAAKSAAKSSLFTTQIFSRTMGYFTRVEPAIATSLRYWQLEDGVRQAEDYRYTVDPYVRLFKQSERWSWDNLYQMKLGARWGEVSDKVLGIKLNTDYVRKVQSRSEFSVRGRYERARGLSEEILIGDISFVDHDLLEAAFGFSRGKGRDRVHFDGTIYARVVDYDNDINLTVDFSKFSHDRLGISGNIYYQFRPRISYWVGVDVSDYDYSDSDLDNRDLRAVVGGEFLFSSRLSAKIVLGLQDKEFDGDDFDSTTWDAYVDWQPRFNTRIVFRTMQEIAELQEANALTVRRGHELGWTQTWSKKFSTELGWMRHKRTFDGYNIRRRDLYFNLNYATSRKVTLIAKAIRYDQDISNGNERDSFLVELTADYKF